MMGHDVWWVGEWVGQHGYGLSQHGYDVCVGGLRSMALEHLEIEGQQNNRQQQWAIAIGNSNMQ